MRSWQQLAEFWFGAPGSAEARLTARLPLWFLKDAQADAKAAAFAPWLVDYEEGKLASWRDSIPGTLALVLLLDQIPRNAYRGSAESYRYDAAALAVSLDAIERGFERELSTLEKLFLYLPIEHSEDPTMQRLSVAKFDALQESAPAELSEFARLVYEFAVKHQEVIARFGRYPHRNTHLGRASTPEELAFLLEPGSAF